MITIYAKITTRKIMAGSTQNQQRIVGRGCCFGRVGLVKLQQRVVDRFCWSGHKNILFKLFFTSRIFWEIINFLLYGFLWHSNPITVVGKRIWTRDLTLNTWHSNQLTILRTWWTKRISLPTYTLTIRYSHSLTHSNTSKPHLFAYVSIEKLAWD